MHLGNGAITPECGLVALGIAAAGVGVGVVSARALGFDRGRARTAGALGTAVFAAQMFNVQILPYSSMHLIGGVLLAWVLGPALGLLSMTVVLTLQALLLGDGGLLALGANVVNMGLVPAAALLIVERLGLRNSRHCTVALGATAFLATLMGAGLITVEVAVGRGAAQLDGWSGFAWRMIAAHICAGLLEGLATMALVALLNAAREPRTAGIVLSAPNAAVVAVASLAVALVSLPSLGIASAAPDAYESALAAVSQSGHALGAIETPDRLSGIGATVQSWQEALTSALPMPEAAVVVLGALLAGIGAGLCALCCVRRPVDLSRFPVGAS